MMAKKFYLIKQTNQFDLAGMSYNTSPTSKLHKTGESPKQTTYLPRGNQICAYARRFEKLA